MSKSVFYSWVVSFLIFQLYSFGAANILGGAENIIDESDNLNNQGENELLALHPIDSVVGPFRDIKINVKRHVDESPPCSSIVLNFLNMNIGPTVHAYFINGSYVQNLSLANNKIERFDNGAFDGLSNLKLLNLSYNKLSPKNILSFGGHATIETLILDYNKVDDPEEFGNYQKHTYVVRIRSTTIVPSITIPTSNVYPKLKSLSLRGTKFTPSFDNWDQSFPSLEKLDLSYINLENVINSEFFKSIPSTVKILILQNVNLERAIFHNLLNIEELDVSGNSFVNGLDFLNLPNLKKLNLCSTQIVNIPSYLYNKCPNIEDLNLSENRIEIIESHTLKDFKKLKVLKLSNNPLKSIDFIQTLSRLDTLILDDMQNSKIIESLDTLSSPTYKPELKYLSMKNNHLIKLPKTFIKSLNILEEIDLSGNYLSSLPNFSPTLTRLNIRNNNIEYLNDALLHKLSNLKEIKLGNNPMKQVEIELISYLPKSCILNWE